MKKHTYILIILLYCGITSCKKDFLDLDNTQNLFRQTYVKDLRSMQEFMNGNYVIMPLLFEEGNAAAYPELIADNLRPVSVSSNIMIPHYSWTQQSDGADLQLFVALNTNAKAMDPLWRVGYRIIRACNFVLEDINKYKEEDPAKADDIKGQAFAIRAYTFFKLVNTFAQCYAFTPDASHSGIPYITTSDISKPYSRQTVSEVYNGMIADLTNAIQLLPATVTDTRFMNRNAAQALLARIYLFKEDFENARLLAMEVVGQFPLMTIADGYPNDIYKLKTPSQTESLFQLSPSNSGYTTNFISRYLRLTPQRYVATNDIVDILKEDAGDVRKDWVTSASGQWNVTKFPTGVVSGITPAEISYYPAIIRSSEMILTVAEASAKLNDESTARAFLDDIRERANPSIAPVTATGTALLDSIYKERRKELAFESLRMYDLQRWKAGVYRIDALFPSAKDLPYPSEKAIAPIPLTDIQLMGLNQNSGY